VSHAPGSAAAAVAAVAAAAAANLPTAVSLSSFCFAHGKNSAAAAEASLPSSLRATFSAVSGDTAEQLSDCLLGLGAQSVVVQEARQEGQPEQEKFGAEAELWDSCQVLAHFPMEVSTTPL
jgi:hypothetical protein